MTKNELLKTPEIKPTRQIIEALAKRINEGYYKNVPQYAVALRCQKVRGEEIYKIAAFTNPKTASAYIFIWPKENKYITWDVEEKKWRTAMIWYMFPVRYYRGQEKSFSSRPTFEMLKTVLKVEGKTAYDMIAKWQQGIKDRIREDKKQREKDRINKEYMNFVKPEPKNFRNWARKQYDQYIFYDYARNVKTGWCTRCNAIVPVKKPKHRKEAYCQNCKKKITFICNSRKDMIWTDGGRLTLVQNFKDGIIARSYTYRKKVWYKGEQLFLNEVTRQMITSEGYKEFEYDMGSWKDALKGSNYQGEYYTWWLNDEIQYLDHISSGLKKLRSSYLLTDRSVNVVNYIGAEQTHPVIEKCAKAGLTKLANEFVTKWDAKKVLDSVADGELAKDLGIDKMRMGRLRKQNGGWELLQWYQEEKINDTIWDDEILFNFASWDIDYTDIDGMLEKIPMTKLYHYLLKQSKLGTMSVRQVVQTWNDYMSMATRLKMDTDKSMVYMPKDLHRAHNDCIDLINTARVEEEAKKLRKKWPKVDKNCRDLKKYEFKDKKYCIVAPKGVADIYREGMVLRHCLHTCDIYWNRITEKITFLMFLRKADSPDTPWYTLEVEPGGNIRQKRTVGDNQNPDLKEAMPFLKKWQKHIQKIMNDEDRKLAERSDKQRRENYKEIRKEQKRVWHGKLQGQLLADVLEADFMAAI